MDSLFQTPPQMNQATQISHVVPPDIAANTDVSPLPRMTALVREGNNEWVEQLAEFTAFEIIRLPIDADIAQINSTGAALIGLFAENTNEAIDTCRRLLMSHLAAPLIVLTPVVDAFREALLLEMGARDVVMLERGRYVAVARIRTVLQTLAHRDGQGISSLTFGRLEIDRGGRLVRFNKKEIHLTTAEFDTLWILARSAGRPVDRSELHLRDHNTPNLRTSRFVDYRINRLRNRMTAETGQHSKIRTVRSTGYMFSTSAW